MTKKLFEAPTNNPWKTHEIKEVFDNPWIQLSDHKVTNPSGKPGSYSVVHFKSLAIGILPLDHNLDTWLVGQYRYPIGEYTWEIPEGGGDLSTSPLETAKRELKEETGIIAKEYTLVQESQLSNSVSDEIAYIYVAQQLSFGDAMPDENEEILVKKVSFDKFYELVLNGTIKDSLSVMAALKVKLLLNEGKLM